MPNTFRTNLVIFLRLIVLALLIQKCSAEWFAKSEECYDINNEPLNCPSNVIYYFECCSNECCLRTQIVPAVIIAMIASVMTIFCLVSCVAYCCCGE
uniref:Uncharacterized protein n=1 Tax=Caenorhabditis japonica TaxID=281687 RepID=A0A8R1ICM7_CAEJA